ncbi:MAG: hypothetical protein OXC11_13410 [Rhodospirillales bacterium]|nr:hypothetical protein [Rhodospirillales bacterium]
MRGSAAALQVHAPFLEQVPSRADRYRARVLGMMLRTALKAGQGRHHLRFPCLTNIDGFFEGPVHVERVPIETGDAEIVVAEEQIGGDTKLVAKCLWMSEPTAGSIDLSRLPALEGVRPVWWALDGG